MTYPTIFAAARDIVGSHVTTCEVGARASQDTGIDSIDSRTWDWDDGEANVDFLKSNDPVVTRTAVGTVVDVYVFGWVDGEKQLDTNIQLRRTEDGWEEDD